MKVIFSTYEAKEIGGSYLRSLSLAQGLVELGHEVTLWTSAIKPSLKIKKSNEGGVNVLESVGIFPYRFRKGGYDPLDLIVRTTVILFSECGFFHSFNHRPTATWPGLIKKIFSPQMKWFVDWADLWGRGGIADRRYGKFSFITKNVDHYTEKLFIKIPDAVTPISDDLVDKAIKIRGSANGVYFLGVGANIKGIKPIKKKLAREKIGLDEKIKVLSYLYVGTYDEELLAKTFVILNKIRSDVKLILLGPKLPKLEKIVTKFPDASKKILRLGVVSRDKLRYYLGISDILMMPFADKEINLGKFPNKLGDYLASGRPIAGNPTGEVKKLMTAYDVGRLFPEDPKSFAQGIDKMLDNPRLLEKIGKNSRKVGEQISWLSVSKKLESFYCKEALSKLPL